MKLIYFIAVFTLLYTSCSNSTDIYNLLENVESYMEIHPDSALHTLNNIDKTLLCNSNLKAKYSLLKSIALDKNYIDTTNFNVIQPAIDYYLKRGDATEKLRTYYYMGRICKNAGNEEEAMKYYVLGLSHGKDSDDCLTKARLLFSKGQIHNNLYQYHDYCREMSAAAELFKTGDKQSSYFNSLSNAFNGYKLLGDTLNAKNVLDKLIDSIDWKKISQASDLYEMKISYCKMCKKQDSIKVLLESYTSDIDAYNVDWLSVAKHYIDIKEPEEALNAIKTHNKYFKYKPLRYFITSSRIYESLGNHREALENYKMYIKLSDSADMAIFRANTKFVEEKYALQLQNERERNSKRIVAVCAIMAILLLAAVIKCLHTAMKQNKEKYQRQCELLEYEKENLLELLEKNRHPDSKIREAIEGRLAIINQFFKAHITENYDLDKKAVKEMEMLFDNKRKFIEDTTLIIKGNNPQFIAHLKQNDLTEQEIHFTCLYIIGLRGVHIGKYLETTNIYNISSGIRKKLGIDEYKTNLDKLITELYENCMG